MGGRAYKGLWPLEFVVLKKIVQLGFGRFCSISVSIQQLMLSLKSVLVLARQGDSWKCVGGGGWSSLVPGEGPVSPVTGGCSS